ncbi:MAG TPA: recombinase family protein [Chryseosolibacter sp.]|nr:recombinase family protein [Chryseosolibacter sp.]
MKAVIYSRVSTLDQDNARQIQELKEYAKYRKMNLVNVYEEKITGASKAAERTEFKKLLEYITANKVNTVLVWEVSRLGRSMLDVLNNIELLSNQGINIFFKKESMNTLDDTGKKSTMTNMLISILSGFAEMERETIRQRSISGIRQNVASGGSGTGIVKAYGFKKVGKKLEIDKEEAEVIKLIYKKYLEGLGTKMIANLLNDKNIPTRFNKLFANKSIPQKHGIQKKGSDYNWREGTVYTILTNSIYKGERKHKGEIFSVPAIIDADIFDAVQQRLTTHFNKKDNNRIYENILKDLLICGKCGRSYFMHKRADNSDNAYKCISKRYDEYCGNPSINIDKLNQSLFKASWYVARPSKENKHSLRAELENKQIQASALKKEIDKLNNRLDTLLNMRLDNQLTAKQFSDKNSEIKSELEKKENQLLKINQDLALISNAINQKQRLLPTNNYTFDDFKANLKALYKSFKVHQVENMSKFSDVFTVKGDVAVCVEMIQLTGAIHYVVLSQRSKQMLQVKSKKGISKPLTETEIQNAKFDIVDKQDIFSPHKAVGVVKQQMNELMKRRNP